MLSAADRGDETGRSVEALSFARRRPGSGTLAAVIVATIALFVLTGLLTRSYRAERIERARHHLELGNRLSFENRNEEAVEHYRAALSLARTNAEYEIALALALAKAGKTREAETHLSEILRGDPTNAIANLVLARILSAEGRHLEAAVHYHRAIYGLWPEDPGGNRARTRLELAEFLGTRGARKQAVAELLALLGEAAADPKMKPRIGRMLLAYGAPEPAVEVFRHLLRRNVRDAEAWAGLGQAQFARGDYRAAQDAFRGALRWSPKNEDAKRQLDLSEQIMALDPTLRGLGWRERQRRSRELAWRALAALESCVARSAAPPSSGLQKLLENARQSLATKGRQQRDDDAAEADVVLAERLAAASNAFCTQPEPQDRVLALILAKVSR